MAKYFPNVLKPLARDSLLDSDHPIMPFLEMVHLIEDQYDFTDFQKISKPTLSALAFTRLCTK